MADWYTVSALAFIAILFAVFYRDRKNVKRESVLLLRRTKRGKRLITAIGSRFPRFWKGVGLAAVAVGFFCSIYFLYAICDNLLKLFTGQIRLGAGLVIPSLTQEVSIGPGYFAIPFWYWIISIALIFVVHEGMHGIMAVREKIRIKSLGWGLLAVFLLAFVEPDEKQVARKKPMQQLRFFAAGSFGNFLMAGLSALVIALITMTMFMQAGIDYSGLVSGYPASEANISGVITGVNGHEIRNTTEFSAAMADIGPGKLITLHTKTRNGTAYESKSFTLMTVERPDNASGGFIGISGVGNYLAIAAGLEPFTDAIYFASELFFFIFLLNLAIAMVNLLPLKPFDGGKMWELVFMKLSRRNYRYLVNGLGLFTLAVLAGNFVVPFLVW